MSRFPEKRHRERPIGRTANPARHERANHSSGIAVTKRRGALEERARSRKVAPDELPHHQPEGEFPGCQSVTHALSLLQKGGCTCEVPAL